MLLIHDEDDMPQTEVAHISPSRRRKELETTLQNDRLLVKSRWSSTSTGDVFWEHNGVIVDSITPGLYQLDINDKLGTFLSKRSAQTDDLIMIGDEVIEKVTDEVLHFWQPEIKTRYKERGFLYKRGILMHGNPGSGKTSTIQFLIKKLIGLGGVALYTEHSRVLVDGLQMIRRIEPSIPIIVILEDFETLTQNGRDENQWLSVMDGEGQVDNVVFLATTNYVERLDKRFINRPSRFDLVVPVHMPSAAARAHYLRVKEPEMTLDDIRHWVEVTQGYSFAHLKELIIAVRVLGNPLEDVMERLQTMREGGMTTVALDQPKTRAGFGHRSVEDEREVVDWEAFAATHFS